MGKNNLQNTSVRFPPETMERIKRMADKFNFSNTDIVRLTTEAGLTALERMDSEGLTNHIAKGIAFTVATTEEKDQEPQEGSSTTEEGKGQPETSESKPDQESN